jgi:transketolase
LSFIAQVATIPHVEVYSLSTSSEAEALVTAAVESFAADRAAGKVPPTRIFFLGRENFPRTLAADNARYELGKDQVLLDTTAEATTNPVTIVAAGSLVPEALKAADQLREKKVGAVVIHGASVNHPDTETIGKALAKTGGRLVTVEDHRMMGGMGALLVHALTLKGQNLKVRTLGVGDHFGQSAYSALDLYKRNGLDSASIAKAASELA